MRTIRITSLEDLEPFEHKGESTRVLKVRRRLVREGGTLYLPESIRETEAV